MKLENENLIEDFLLEIKTICSNHTKCENCPLFRKGACVIGWLPDSWDTDAILEAFNDATTGNPAF